MRSLSLLALLSLGGCATYPQLVMLNPRTGATVDCQQPDFSGGTADFLVSRACLSACEAHGFFPVPGMQAASARPGIPDKCVE